MPLPKRRHSNQRTRKRRTHYKLTHTPALIPSADQAGGFTLLHRLDLDSGRYRDRQVFAAAEDEQTAA